MSRDSLIIVCGVGAQPAYLEMCAVPHIYRLEKTCATVLVDESMLKHAADFGQRQDGIMV